MPRSLRAAFCFLTRIPVGGSEVFSGEDVGKSVVYFSVVGAALAVLQWASIGCLSWLGLSVVFQAVLSTAFLMLLTGGLHQDAVADTFDGLGGGQNREQMLVIMRDSRVGTYGALALIVSALLRIMAMVVLIESDGLLPWLIAAFVLGRCSSSVLAGLMPYARIEEKGLGSALTDHVGPKQIAGSTILSVLIVTVCLGNHTIVALILSALVTAYLGRVYWRKLRGVTGDNLGAATEIVELCVLVLGATCLS